LSTSPHNPTLHNFNMKSYLPLVLFSLLLCPSLSMLLDFQEDLGGIPADASHDTCRHNTQVLSNALQNNASHNTLHFPFGKTFHLTHGVHAKNVNDTVILLDGVLRFERLDKKQYQKKRTPACLFIDHGHNITLTSNHRGVIDGRGSQYWGIPLFGYMQFAESRPRMLVFRSISDLLIERVILQDSPYHTLNLEHVDRVVVRNMSIVARRTKEDGHNWIDLTAFNTDGIDVSGHNVHVYDVDIWTQDDCIAVKDNYDSKSLDFISSNMTFERINASGFGLAIGSIGGSTVRNITFRDSYLHRTVKGIYLKFHSLDDFSKAHNLTGLIEDIVFENIAMEETLQFSVFMGPAQQADNRNPCFANPCSLCWPWSPTAQCNVVDQAKFRNITIRNTLINNPKMSPGVILGDASNPMEDLVFDNVRVTKGKVLPYAKEELTVTFPGLKQPIDDKYVPDSYQMSHYATDRPDMAVLQAALESIPGLLGEQVALFDNPLHHYGLHLALLMVAFLVIVRSKTRNATRTMQVSSMSEDLLAKKQPAPHRTHLKRYLCCASVAIGFLLCHFYVSILEFGKPKWQKTSSYFRCEGAHGIAKGTTWPVPDCFEQESPSWNTLLPSDSDATAWSLGIFVSVSLLSYSCLLACFSLFSAK
jgi:polygalacturonase